MLLIFLCILYIVIKIISSFREENMGKQIMPLLYKKVTQVNIAYGARLLDKGFPTKDKEIKSTVKYRFSVCINV